MGLLFSDRVELAPLSKHVMVEHIGRDDRVSSIPKITKNQILFQITPNKKLLARQLAELRTAITDRFDRLYKREKALGVTVRREKPLVIMLPPDPEKQ
jgi:hypothetical protein